MCFVCTILFSSHSLSAFSSFFFAILVGKKRKKRHFHNPVEMATANRVGKRILANECLQMNEELGGGNSSSSHRKKNREQNAHVYLIRTHLSGFATIATARCDDVFLSVVCRSTYSLSSCVYRVTLCFHSVCTFRVAFHVRLFFRPRCHSIPFSIFHLLSCVCVFLCLCPGVFIKIYQRINLVLTRTTRPSEGVKWMQNWKKAHAKWKENWTLQNTSTVRRIWRK